MQLSSFTYLIIDGLIILVPLLYSRDRRLRYDRSYPALGVSIAMVSLFYIGWDVVVTDWGEWSFNSEYVTGIYLLNLPVEEILFFFAVPYSCLFIYEAVQFYAKEGTWRIPTWVFLALALFLLAVALVFREQGYTAKALGSAAFFILCAILIMPGLLRDRKYWLWLALCYIPFLMVNTVLTALPVVQYNPSAIWGSRFITIPYEDFLYNFSLLSFYALVYITARQVRQARRANGRRPAVKPEQGNKETSADFRCCRGPSGAASSR